MTRGAGCMRRVSCRDRRQPLSIASARALKRTRPACPHTVPQAPHAARWFGPLTAQLRRMRAAALTGCRAGAVRRWQVVVGQATTSTLSLYPDQVVTGAELPALPALRALNLKHCPRLHDAGLAALAAACPGLAELHVRADALSGGGLAGLAGLGALTRLELLDPRAAAAGGRAAAVAALTGLQVLLPASRPAAPACRSCCATPRALAGQAAGRAACQWACACEPVSGPRGGYSGRGACALAPDTPRSGSTLLRLLRRRAVPCGGLTRAENHPTLNCARAARLALDAELPPDGHQDGLEVLLGLGFVTLPWPAQELRVSRTMQSFHPDGHQDGLEDLLEGAAGAPRGLLEVSEGFYPACQGSLLRPLPQYIYL